MPVVSGVRACVSRFSTTRRARANKGFAQLARDLSGKGSGTITTRWQWMPWERARGRRYSTYYTAVPFFVSFFGRFFGKRVPWKRAVLKG